MTEFTISVEENSVNDTLSITVKSIDKIRDLRKSEEILRKLHFCFNNLELPREGSFKTESGEMVLSQTYADPEAFQELRDDLKKALKPEEEDTGSTKTPLWV